MPYTKLNRFSLKRNNVKVFLFFLIFTSVLWLFKQFSKNYTEEVVVAIQYVNLPEDRILNTENSDQILKLMLNGNGFRLVKYSWKNPIIELDIADAVKSEGTTYYFSLDDKNALFKDKLNFKGNILSKKKDTLKVQLDINLQKKVPVRVIQDVTYTAGYGSDLGVVILPDSIYISGPEYIVDTLKYVETKRLLLEDVHKDYSEMLSVETRGLPKSIKVNSKEVEVAIAVSKFTEGSKEVQITLMNVPKGKQIKIFPKQVTVVYRVGLDTYNDINNNDFKVIADYNKVAENSSFLILELINKPSSIHDARLQNKQVQYVILNKQ